MKAIEQSRSAANRLQTDLWLDCHLRSASLHVIPFTLKLTGASDKDKLRMALERVVTRHDALRQAFVSERGAVFTTTSEAASFSLPIEFAAVPLDDDAAAAAKARALAEQGFDLTTPPLWRMSLHPGFGEHSYLVCAFHHLVCDGASLALLSHELVQAYDGEAPLEEARPAYEEFSHRLEALSLRAGSGAQAHWKTQLSERPDAFAAFGLQRRGGAGPDTLVRFRIDGALADAVRTTCGALTTTPFALLLSAFATTLWRHGVEAALVIGCPADQRLAVRMRSVIGHCTSMMPLSIDLCRTAPFAKLVRDVRDNAMAAFTHSHLGLGEIGAAAGAGRDRLFRFAFTFHPPFPAIQSKTLSATPIAMERSGARYDLILSVTPKDENFECWIEFDGACFEPSGVSEFAQRFLSLLAAALADPSSSLADLFAHAEREAHSSPESEPFGAVMTTIVDRFATEAARNGQRIAIQTRDGQLSYKELDEASNDLAGVLHHLGAGPEAIVATCMARSAESIVMLLAIVKAGACYFPLDPHDPPERLEALVAAAKASIIVVDDVGEALLGGGNLRGFHHSEELRQLAFATGGAPFRREIDPARLCYVMATSGSTGYPNLVAIPHSAVVRLISDHALASVCANGGMLHTSSQAFDASTLEIWGPLLNGGTCYVIDDRFPTPAHLRALSAEGVRAAWLTSSLFNSIVDQDPASLAGFTHVLSGGEALSPRHVERAIRACPQTQFLNGYGPTETTTFASTHVIALEDCESDIPIGRPIALTTLRVLDPDMRPCPPGVPGELYIGGPGTARGYLNQPGLTAAKFRPDPFSSTGERLYRSGDLVVETLAGDLHFLRRTDDQIKLRGRRIELSEVERRLMAVDEIANAVATIVVAPSGERLLAAYVVAHNQAIDLAALARRLGSEVASYLVPSKFVVVDALPVTRNGKVDRSRLPAISWEEAPAQDTLEGLAADHPIIRMSKIWTRLLSRAPRSAHDDFFEVGGSSLLAARLCAGIEEEFGAPTSLSDIFDHPRLGEQADLAARHVPTPSESAASRGNRRRLAMSAAQARFWLQHQISEPGALNLALVFAVSGELDVDRLQSALTALVERHETLRASYHSDEGGLYWRAHDFVPAQVKDVRECPPFALLELATEFVHAPFDLTQPCPFRVGVFATASGERALAFAIHHIAADAWSLDLIAAEFATLYAGNEPPPAADYSAFCDWERARLEDKATNADADFWRRRFAVMSPPVFGAKTNPAASPLLRIDGDLPEKVDVTIATLASRFEVSAFALWLSVIALALVSLTGRRDLTIGAPFSLRGPKRFDATVGPLLNTIPIKIQVPDHQPYPEFCRELADEARRAFAHGFLPFEAIRAASGAEISAQPLFNIMFGFNERVPHSWSLSGATLSPVAIGARPSKHDLAIFCTKQQHSHQFSVACSEAMAASGIDANVFFARVLAVTKVLDARSEATLLDVLNAAANAD